MMPPKKRSDRDAFLKFGLQVFVIRFDHLIAKTAPAFQLIICLWTFDLNAYCDVIFVQFYYYLIANCNLLCLIRGS